MESREIRMSNEDTSVKDTAEAIAALAQCSPLYEDALHPGMQEAGKAIQTLGKTVNVALAPLRGLIWGYEQIEKFLVTALAKKLENTPPEEVVTPKANVAGPAIEALRFTANEPTLREMYAQLLATGMQ